MFNLWNERYAGDEYHFGTRPNEFLESQRHFLQAGMSCLAVADGEGRNGVWLAQQGLQVVSVDASEVALAKAKKLANERAVSVRFELADLLRWESPALCGSAQENVQYDVVVAIFIQFTSPQQRAEMFKNIKGVLKPGGLLLLQGYTPQQLEYGTGGPSQVENLYTEVLLRALFAEMEILHLAEHHSCISEGVGHQGMSALIDLVARK